MARNTSKQRNRVTADQGPRAANGLRATSPMRRGPARLTPLSVLPVFADLRGRSALVVGGGEGAAWKAELLVAAGANVTHVLGGDGEEFCEEARELAERIGVAAPPLNGMAHPLSGRNERIDGFGTIHLLDRAWSAADLFGHAPANALGFASDRPALALIDTECHGEAAAFAALARTAGVTVNAIDKPFHGDITFGSIVNRSPVVVGISTDGAAPILGQRIRQRIEALLPPALSEWAGAMRAARGRVLAMLPGRAERRRFFERFADLAMRGADQQANPAEALLAVSASVSDAGGSSASPIGHVTLVGAGPGDGELLTIKAVRALQSADVVLFDALVSEDVLELARREAKRMLVGKRAGKESCRQEDINALMLKLAGPMPGGGKRVVRLKSGDPMVFGRAGEEIEALAQANIPHEVIPGITSAQALAASLNVSLTHRALARSVRFVTGHGANGQLPTDLDWRGLADPATTLVIYMGARTAPLIAERLVNEGLAPNTPAIAASAVARPEQQTWHGTVATLARGVETLPNDQPILIAIGDAMVPPAAMLLPQLGEAEPTARIA